MTFVDPKHVRLDALAVVARAHGLSAEPLMGGLVIKNGRVGIVVTCLPYAADGGRLWFFAEPDRAPLGEADDARMMDVVMAVKRVLAEVKGVLAERGLS